MEEKGMDVFRTDITNRALTSENMQVTTVAKATTKTHINLIPEGALGYSPNGRLVSYRMPCCHGSRNI